MTKIERTARFFDAMSKLGFTYSEAQSLRRIELTLQRWAEKECGDSNSYASYHIERDDQTGKPYWVVMPHNLPPSKGSRTLIPDREAGALKRLAKIMEKHPELWSYHQGDCRGCMLYIGRGSDLSNIPGTKEQVLSSHYTRGVAVCI